jgi:hypothetical protein
MWNCKKRNHNTRPVSKQHMRKSKQEIIGYQVDKQNLLTVGGRSQEVFLLRQHIVNDIPCLRQDGR